MRVITSIEELKHQVQSATARNERIGLVPTRGDLHEGHAALIRTARAQCDLTICSIIRADGTPAVHEPQDERIARDAGVNLVWRPAAGPLIRNARFKIMPNDAPHLANVATADMHQLGLVRPHAVYVGDEHYEHARLLRDLIVEMQLAIDVRICPTPRTPDGLPVGAGTLELSSSAREAAAVLPRAFDLIETSVADGERSLFRLRARMETRLADAGEALEIDDVATVDPESFEPIDVFDRDVMLVVHARVDNLPIVDSRLLKHAPQKQNP